LASYSSVNAANLSDSTNLNQGVLLYNENGYFFGMDLGYSKGAYSTRLFAPESGQITFSTYSKYQAPSTQTSFVDLFSINTRTGSATFNGNNSGVIMSGTGLNTDLTGELAFTGTQTATYSFAGTYSSHPECILSPQFNVNGNLPWITYSGISSFTINFASPVTGSVSYSCNARN